MKKYTYIDEIVPDFIEYFTTKHPYLNLRNTTLSEKFGYPNSSIDFFIKKFMNDNNINIVNEISEYLMIKQIYNYKIQ